MININAQIMRLIAITIAIHKSYLYGIMSEITFNITIHVLTKIDNKGILFHNDWL